MRAFLWGVVLAAGVVAAAPALAQSGQREVLPTNVRPQAYPPVLATTGLWDSQVQYFEPAKWVAKLRQHNTGSEPLLLHVNLEAGHGGKSGRYEHMREVAREYGFIIALADGMRIGGAS